MPQPVSSFRDGSVVDQYAAPCARHDHAGSDAVADRLPQALVLTAFVIGLCQPRAVFSGAHFGSAFAVG